jgi:hypothetical protein
VRIQSECLLFSQSKSYCDLTSQNLLLVSVLLPTRTCLFGPLPPFGSCFLFLVSRILFRCQLHHHSATWRMYNSLTVQISNSEEGPADSQTVSFTTVRPCNQQSANFANKYAVPYRDYVRASNGSQMRLFCDDLLSFGRQVKCLLLVGA